MLCGGSQVNSLFLQNDLIDEISIHVIPVLFGGGTPLFGHSGKHISLEDAPSYIFGVTIGNDWSENTWFPERQRTEEPSRFLSKSMDTWACLYHTIYTGIDYSDLQIEIRLNTAVQAPLIV